MIFPVFVAIYAMAHIFIWQVLATGFRFSGGARILLACILLVLCVTPFLARRLERRGFGALARLFAWVGYTWAGLVLFFVMARLGTDIVFGLSALVSPRIVHNFTRAWGLVVTGVLTAALALYAFIERSRVRIELVEVPTDKDIGDRVLLRVAQISDVHIGSMNGPRRIRALLRRLEECQADVIVSTGDLIDSRAGLAVPVTEMLAGLNPPLGKFAIVGNHEFYAGLNSSLAFMERAGFTVLRNAAVDLAGVHLVGMDDPALGQPIELVRRENVLLRGLSEGIFTILLKHRPDVVPGSEARFDLQLSGHTHKGQMFPFGFLTRLYYPAHAGLFRLARASYLYVSRGTGAWGPPFRLMAPPEVTLFTIGKGLPDPGGQVFVRMRPVAPQGEPAPSLSATAYSQRRP